MEWTGLHVFHSWKYLDPEHRICSKCGECQLFYDSLWFWQTESRVTYPDEGSPENRVRCWKSCPASTLKAHMEIRRKEIEELKRKEQNEPSHRLLKKPRDEREKEAAFALLKEHGFEQNVPVCGKCGAKIVADANFCTNCGRALPARTPHK